MTLFWHPTGPLLSYRDGVLHVADLNPQIETKWRMTRLEMLWLGLRSLWCAVALRPRKERCRSCGT